MNKIINQIKKFAVSLMAVVCGIVTLSIPSFAYNTTDYDQVEDDGTIIVSEKENPNVTCQVSLIILYPQDKFKEGRFVYEFTAEDVAMPEGYEGQSTLPLIFLNRLENAKKLDTQIGTGDVIYFKFFVEPGTYNFSKEWSTSDDLRILKPDTYTLPEKFVPGEKSENSAAADQAFSDAINAGKSVDEALAAMDAISNEKQPKYYPIEVTPNTSSITLYAICGDDKFTEANKAAFEEYAKKMESGDAREVTFDGIDPANYSSLAELIGDLKDMGYSDEELELAREVFGDYFNNQVAAIEDDTESEEVAETAEETVEEEPEKPINVSLIVIVGIIIGIMAGVIVVVRKLLA